MEKKTWDTIFGKNKNIAVVPNNDSKEHYNFSLACPCNPKVIMENHLMIIVHHSWDCREYDEVDNPDYGKLIN